MMNKTKDGKDTKEDASLNQHIEDLKDRMKMLRKSLLLYSLQLLIFEITVLWHYGM